MPAWLIYHLMAEDYHMLPEDIEARVSALTVDRWLAVRRARAEAEERANKASGGRNLLDG